MIKLSIKWTKQAVFAVLAACTVLAVLFAPAYLVSAAQTPVDLGTADSFAVLAGSTITNTGIGTVVTGNVGLHPGSAVVAFPPGTLNGVLHVNDGVAIQAKNDLVTAYNDAAGRLPVTTVATELGGTTLGPGVYDSAAGTFGITGTLILDGQGDTNAVFIFKMASTLDTAANNSIVSLINGAQACNVFWQVGSSATLGTNTMFVGTILAMESITVTTGATVEGRLLARTGAVTMDTNNISVAVSGVAPLPGTLEIFKFNDLDGDGIQDGGELPLAGWAFTVTGGPSSTPGPYSTDGNGLITISDLSDGTYNVTETVQADWIVTTANPQIGTVSASGGRRLNFSNRQTVSPVGGEAYPINKVAVLAPWMALIAAIMAGTTIFVRRYGARG